MREENTFPWVVVISLVVLGLVAYIIYAYQKPTSIEINLPPTPTVSPTAITPSPTITINPTPTGTSTPTPTATSTPSINLQINN